MAAFDPFGWCEKYIPATWLYQLIRIGAVLLFCLFLVLRVRQYDLFLVKPLWFVETLIYAVLAAAFFMRIEPVDRSKGVKEILVPLIGGLLPFALLATPPSRFFVQHLLLLRALFWWMTLATALTIWGMWALRRSFSITVEARLLTTGGPYRWVRHPIYLGEILTAAAVAAWRPSWANGVILVLFVTIQLLRARWEEEKLLKNFPDYAKLLARSWWFLTKKAGPK